MREPKSRLDELNGIVLNVANKSGSQLDLSQVPDSRLKLPLSVLRSVPTSFKLKEVEPTLVHGFDYFSPGMTVVVLGGANLVLSYIATQNTTPGGKVINCFTDTNRLEQARAAFKSLPASQAAASEFHYTPNGDFKTQYGKIEQFLKDHPVKDAAGYQKLELYVSQIRETSPLIEDNSVDLVALDATYAGIGNDRLWELAADVYRILKRGGIFLFSLLLSDEKAVEEGYLWENDIERFTHSLKFHGLHCLGRSELPHRVVKGKEIRFHNFVAFKGKEGPCMERTQAVIYNGPWREVKDDDGHTYPRGKRVAVCDKTFGVLSRPPYNVNGQFTYLHPYVDIPLEQAVPFPCGVPGILFRDPKETKGVAVKTNNQSQDCCGPEEDCCSTEDSTDPRESCCGTSPDGSNCC
jgi:arsenite methyltransferase